MPDEGTILRWHDAVPEHFRFCPKVPQTISHAKDMVKMTEDMLHFISVVRELKTKLGTSFLQLPPSFKPDKTFCPIVIDGNGFGFWNTIPTLSRIFVTSVPGA